MKVISQILWIFGMSMAGEVLHGFLPLPVPGSIYGFLLLSIALWTKVLRPEDIREVANFLLETMPVYFIPAAVGILGIVGELRRLLIPVFVVLVVSTLGVMIASGRVTQRLVKGELDEWN